MTAISEQGKEVALAALAERRANKPEKIDNASLPAGSEMYFYCKACGHLSDIKPESYITAVKKLCKECQALKDLGWLE
jgi:hypothetical protein